MNSLCSLDSDFVDDDDRCFCTNGHGVDDDCYDDGYLDYALLDDDHQNGDNDDCCCTYVAHQTDNPLPVDDDRFSSPFAMTSYLFVL